MNTTVNKRRQPVGCLLFITDFQNAANTSLNKGLSLFFLEEEWSGM